MPKVIPESIRDFLYIDNEGVVRWSVRRGRIRANSPAGTYVRNDGYLTISFQKSNYVMHRVVWFLHYGEQPPMLIDHVDGDKTNNTITNLREATLAENGRNRKTHTDNTSGIKGVSWSNYRQKWYAKVSADGMSHHVGYFTDLQEAASAVQEKRAELHGEFANHG